MPLNKPTRGERNNNPGNLRHGTVWVGLADQQTDRDFCTFIDPEHGIRAICKVLLTYKAKGLTSISAVISRWAPPNENDTNAYISAVLANVGHTIVDASKYEDAYPLVEGIIKHENGRNVYPKDVADKGLLLAGIVP